VICTRKCPSASSSLLMCATRPCRGIVQSDRRVRPCSAGRGVILDSDLYSTQWPVHLHRARHLRSSRRWPHRSSRHCPRVMSGCTR
jgi:hypothetical protein